MEIISGIAMYYLDFPFGTQTVHVVLATLLFGVQFYIILESKSKKYIHKNIKFRLYCRIYLCSRSTKMSKLAAQDKFFRFIMGRTFGKLLASQLKDTLLHPFMSPCFLGFGFNRYLYS
jgi:hypothetical protein